MHLDCPEQARFRLFDSITTFLKTASQRQPLVLVLDDLHWADQPTPDPRPIGRHALFFRSTALENLGPYLREKPAPAQWLLGGD